MLYLAYRRWLQFWLCLALALNSYLAAYHGLSSRTTIPSDWYMLRRYEGNTDLLHFEYREKPKSLSTLLDFLAPIPWKSKPLAKVGIRSKPSCSRKMDEVIRATFGDDRENLPVTVFVYMWVNPQFRGRNIGDHLLSLAIEESLKKEVQYMLIVHDDQGSGKLIEYYESRGFVPIYQLLDKAMLKKLR